MTKRNTVTTQVMKIRLEMDRCALKKEFEALLKLVIFVLKFSIEMDHFALKIYLSFYLTGHFSLTI